MPVSVVCETTANVNAALREELFGSAAGASSCSAAANAAKAVTAADESKTNGSAGDDESLHGKLVASAKRVLLSKIEYEEVTNYGQSVLETLKSKYIVLKPMSGANNSNGLSLENGRDSPSTCNNNNNNGANGDSCAAGKRTCIFYFFVFSYLYFLPIFSGFLVFSFLEYLFSCTYSHISVDALYVRVCLRTCVRVFMKITTTASLWYCYCHFVFECVCVCFALRRVCVKETTFIFVVLPSCKIAVIHAASSVLTCKGIAR